MKLERISEWLNEEWAADGLEKHFHIDIESKDGRWEWSLLVEGVGLLETLADGMSQTKEAALEDGRSAMRIHHNRMLQKQDKGMRLAR